MNGTTKAGRNKGTQKRKRKRLGESAAADRRRGKEKKGGNSA